MYDRDDLISGRLPTETQELLVGLRPEHASSGTTWAYKYIRGRVSYGKRKSKTYRERDILLYGPTARLKQLRDALTHLHAVCTCRDHDNVDTYTVYSCRNVPGAPPNIGEPATVARKAPASASASNNNSLDQQSDTN